MAVRGSSTVHGGLRSMQVGRTVGEGGGLIRNRACFSLTPSRARPALQIALALASATYSNPLQ